MHEPYDDDEDNNYDENDYYDKYGYPKDNYKWYYKFDVGKDSPLSEWINEIVNNFMGPFDDKIDKYWGSINSIPGFPFKKFPVNSWNPNTGGNSLQYLGSNYQGSPIWKQHHFIIKKLEIEYVLHLQSHARHFLYQPRYYKGLYEILN